MPAEVHDLIGPNGPGKSALIGCIIARMNKDQ